MSEKPATFSAVIAMASNRVIGRDGALPWRIPGELAWFKSLTMGHPIVMGRCTYDSIGKPLPGRRNIVLSQSLAPGAIEGVDIVGSVEELEALDLSGEETFVIGGTAVFALLLDRCQSVYLTYIFHPYEGDTHLPEFEADFPEVEILRREEEYEIRRYCR